MTDPGDIGLTAGAGAAEVPGTPSGSRHLLLSLLAVAVVVGVLLPFSDADLDGLASFVPAMLALVGSLDLLSAVLLLGQFRDSGDRRSLALASAYVFSLAVLVGYGAAFPGVLGEVGPLGEWPSTAPWLWVVWHTGFPVLLAVAVAPWPARWRRPAAVGVRRRAAAVTVAASVGAGALAVAVAVTGSGWLPVLIDGLDTSAMTRLTGPVILPVVVVATAVAVVGSMQVGGPVRWAALAAAVALGDVVLTLFSLHRYSLGWYVGRTLTVVSCAVVLLAMLAEFGRLKRQLAVEAARLRSLLARTEELEGLHSTLLDHMTDGVMLQDGDGRVVATNKAASALLGLSQDQLHGRSPAHSDWKVVGPDGADWRVEDTPAMLTLRTGAAQRDRMVGVHLPGGGRRWLRVNTSAGQGGHDDGVRFVVSSMTDETARHESHLADTRAHQEKLTRVRAVLDAGGPLVVVQPIVDLRTGVVVGGEALSRFPGPFAQGPDRWFADAAEVGLGTDLELAAVRAALSTHAAMPHGASLSVNVSPTTAVSPELFDLLGAESVKAEHLVLELTEHADVADYPALHTALEDLRRLGVRIAVDDAGAGFASLRHILNLRPDVVKLDLDLVRNIHADPARRALASGLLVFVDQIGAYLVAEGIETSDELDALREVGVTHGQGYHLGRPAALPLPAAVEIAAAPATPRRAAARPG